jgi:AcrR family transcriptional regulator
LADRLRFRVEKDVSDIAKENLRRRSPSVGGYARGEETRARIIAAGLKVFGDEGYAQASTRQIAKAAGVMPPALQYYFDSKEGLHRACAEFIMQRALGGLNAALAAGEVALATGGCDAAINALCDILDALVDTSLFTKTSPAWANFTARMQSERDSPAAALIQAQIVQPLRDLSARLVARAKGSSVDAQVRLQTLVILGQISALHHNRESALQWLGWPDFNGARRDDIKATLRAQTQAVLKS